MKKIDIEKTKDYYKNLKKEDLCTCAYCLNFMENVKKEYGILSLYLEGLGIDITKPFETSPGIENDGRIDYDTCLYIVIGDRKDFKFEKVGGVDIGISESHPETGIKEEHFVIEVYPITLKWENLAKK